MLKEDIETNKSIGNFGASDIMRKLKETNQSTANILTHCNTGSLATAGYGTALGLFKFKLNLYELKSQ